MTDHKLVPVEPTEENDRDLIQELRRDVSQYDSNIRTSATEEQKNKLRWYRDRLALAADRIESLIAPTPPQSSRDAVRNATLDEAVWAIEHLLVGSPVETAIFAAAIRALKSTPSPTAPTITEDHIKCSKCGGEFIMCDCSLPSLTNAREHLADQGALTWTIGTREEYLTRSHELLAALTAALQKVKP